MYLNVEEIEGQISKEGLRLTWDVFKWRYKASSKKLHELLNINTIQ